MWAMARRLGLDERRLSRDNFKIRLDEMVERCLGCGEVETCKRWLAGGRRQVAYRSFCENASAFDDLRRDRVPT